MFVRPRYYLDTRARSPSLWYGEQSFKFVLCAKAVYGGQGIFQILHIVLTLGVQYHIGNLAYKGEGRIFVLRSENSIISIKRNCIGSGVYFYDKFVIRGNRIFAFFLKSSW